MGVRSGYINDDVFCIIGKFIRADAHHPADRRLRHSLSQRHQGVIAGGRAAVYRFQIVKKGKIRNLLHGEIAHGDAFRCAVIALSADGNVPVDMQLGVLRRRVLILLHADGFASQVNVLSLGIKAAADKDVVGKKPERRSENDKNCSNAAGNQRFSVSAGSNRVPFLFLRAVLRRMDIMFFHFLLQSLNPAEASFRRVFAGIFVRPSRLHRQSLC